MYLQMYVLMLLSIAFDQSTCSKTKMRTLYKGPVKPLALRDKFDVHQWLKSAMPKREDRCPGVSQDKAECLKPGPLGLADGTIPDDRFTASSILVSFRSAKEARLYNNAWWVASTQITFTNSWIKVDLVDSTVVTGVSTQGDGAINNWWVTQYKVAYKTQSSSDYDHVTDAQGDIKVFSGNILEPVTPVTNTFDQSIVATVVRIEPVAWHGGVAMRLELLGCRLA